VDLIRDVALGQQRKNDGELGFMNAIYLDAHVCTVAVDHETIIEWLSPLNSFQRQADIFGTLQPGTGEWLLADPLFKNWEVGSGNILWCRGIRMSGLQLVCSPLINKEE
jgi:hypothetical protein